jgi:hypothetical protein
VRHLLPKGEGLFSYFGQQYLEGGDKTLFEIVLRGNEA